MWTPRERALVLRALSLIAKMLGHLIYYQGTPGLIPREAVSLLDHASANLIGDLEDTASTTT